MILHIHLNLTISTRQSRQSNLLVTLIMRNSKAISDFDFCAVVAAYSQHCPDHPLLVHVASQGVVEDREEHNGLDGRRQRRLRLQRVRRHRRPGEKHFLCTFAGGHFQRRFSRRQERTFCVLAICFESDRRLFYGHVTSLFLWRRFDLEMLAQIGFMPFILPRYAPSICN